MTRIGSADPSEKLAAYKAYAQAQKNEEAQKVAETGPTTPILLCLMMIFLIGGGFCPWLWIGAGVVLATLIGRAIKGCSMTNPAAIQSAQGANEIARRQLTGTEQI